MPVTPFSTLPGMNALFLDYAEQRDRVRDLYPGADFLPPVERNHRAELCDILQRQNQHFGNASASALVQELRNPDTYAVITGQQVGVLTGPMYTLWKAVTILQYCDQQKKKGIRCVPIFWMASEDHNMHEILNFGLLKPDLELIRISLKEHLFLKRQPTGTISVTNPEVRKILMRAFKEIQSPVVKEIYSSGTLSEAFARTLLWLFQGHPLLIVDPSDPDLKKLAAPFFSRFFDQTDQLMSALNLQNEGLQKRNYPVQVKMEENDIPMFAVSDQERRHLSSADAGNPPRVEELSPSALFRPIFQDYIFPTLAYAGGPAEIAYFAQLHPWYEMMGVVQPRLLYRQSVTLVPPATANFLASRNLQPQDMFLSEDAIMSAIIRDTQLDEIRNQIKTLRNSVKSTLDSVKQTTVALDQTLEDAVDTSGRKIDYQLEKISKKTFVAVKRKQHLLSQQIRKTKNVIFPDEKPQERYINIFSFSSRLPELIDQIYGKMDPDANGHQWLYI